MLRRNIGPVWAYCCGRATGGAGCGTGKRWAVLRWGDGHHDADGLGGVGLRPRGGPQGARRHPPRRQAGAADYGHGRALCEQGAHRGASGRPQRPPPRHDCRRWAPTPDVGFQATFTLPPDIKPGKHAVIAVQQGVTDWQPSLLGVIDPAGVVPQVAQSAAAAEAAAPPPDETVPRLLAGVLALALAGLAVGSAVKLRRGLGQRAEPAGWWQRVQPSVAALVAGGRRLCGNPTRPRRLARGARRHRPRRRAGGLEPGPGPLHPRRARPRLLGGVAVWLVSEDVIPRDRSQAAAVTGLGLGMLLSARLARSPQQRTSWLYTAAICTFNAGLSYYVLYDLPAAFARWSAFTIFLLSWAVWEQYSAGRMAQAVPDQEAPTAEGAVEALPARDAAEPALEPSPR